MIYVMQLLAVLILLMLALVAGDMLGQLWRSLWRGYNRDKLDGYTKRWGGK